MSQLTGLEKQGRGERGEEGFTYSRYSFIFALKGMAGVYSKGGGRERGRGDIGGWTGAQANIVLYNSICGLKLVYLLDIIIKEGGN